jgi:adenosylhomocysteinase
LPGKRNQRKAVVQLRPSGTQGNHDVADLALASQGKQSILWADQQMPVLARLREQFEKEKPLKGMVMGACLHITAETANLMRALKAGGAEVACCASNPLSTQDPVAASMVEDFGISVYAIRGEDRDTYYRHLAAVLRRKPRLTMDDGADLVSLLHTDFSAQASDVIASMEETTTGVTRLRAMEEDGALKIPVVAVNDALTKHLFDNRYGTGQSTLDGIIRATGILLAGTVTVIAGYGWCGRGVAARARGLGANVIVTEVNPVRALEAAMDGFRVARMSEAARLGDVFITVTGDKHVLAAPHFALMKDGALLANSGHFDVEIDIAALGKMARSVKREVRPNVDCYYMPDGRRIYLLGQGRLVNLACATGHPAQVMDMSFATQALVARWAVRQGKLPVRVHNVPSEVENTVASLKLRAMGLKIDSLSSEQKHYLSSWAVGT